MLSSKLNQELMTKSKEADNEKSSAYEIIQSLLFMVAYSTGLGILGSTYTLEKFKIDSLLADFLIMFLVILTYTMSHHMIAYCCRESSEKFNFAEYLEDNFGKVAALIYDVLMTVHNLILLAYIQFFVAHFMVEGSGNEGKGDSAYYFLAIVNIPLIIVSLYSEFKKIRWFCIVLLVTWLYVFIGRIVDVSNACSSEDYWNEFPVQSKVGFDTWLIKLIGLQLYFASAFQSVPFIYKEAKKEEVMSKVINLASFFSLIIYFTVYLFYTMDPASKSDFIDPHHSEVSGNSTVEEVPGSSCKDNLSYQRVSDLGRVLAGACAIIINVIPARFSLAQLLSGNDAETLKKASGSDRVLSSLLLTGSIIMSLFMFNKPFWRVTVCLGVILSSLLGVLIPVIALMFSKEYSRIIWPNWKRPENPENKNKNENHFVKLTENLRKVFIFSYLGWASLFTIFGIVSGFFIMTDS
jgi:hypothetical protein